MTFKQPPASPFEPPQANPSPQQAPNTDTGLIGLVMMARLHGIAADPDQLAHEYRHGEQLFGHTEILLAGKKLGLSVKAVKVAAGRLSTTPLPALARAIDGSSFILALPPAEPMGRRHQRPAAAFESD